MNILKLVIIVSLFLTSQWAHGDYPKTDADFAVLPPYCKARLSPLRDKDPSYEEWSRRLGHDFIHIHHYCAGLHAMNEGNKIFDMNEKKAFFRNAIGEMHYLEMHASSTFRMLPKISYDIGQLYEKMDNTQEAMQAYQRSIKSNPKLPMPYAALSDMFIKQKNNKEAILILEQGLKYKPTSKALLKRMEKLAQKK